MGWPEMASQKKMTFSLQPERGKRGNIYGDRTHQVEGNIKYKSLEVRECQASLRYSSQNDGVRVVKGLEEGQRNTRWVDVSELCFKLLKTLTLY